MNALNIESICDGSPRFKQNVEISFYISQIFYPKLAFLKNINTLEDFRKNIDEFAISYNLKFNKKSKGLNLFRWLSNYLIENHIVQNIKLKYLMGVVTFDHIALAQINKIR